MTRLENRHPRVVQIVDDDPISRAALQAQLSSWQIHSIESENAFKALVELARTTSYVDCVIADYELPDMKGDQLVSAIHNGLVDGRPPPPVVIVSASTNAESRRRCLDAGAIAYFAKPIDAAALRALIETTPRAPMLNSSAPVPPSQLNTLARQWRHSMRGDGDTLRALIANNDLDGVAQFAHRIAGSAAIAGWHKLQQQALATEQAARSSRTMPISEVEALAFELYQQAL